MKKLILALFVAAFLMVGNADAAKGFWFAQTGGVYGTDWVTFVHAGNFGATTVTATVTFYGVGTSSWNSAGASIGSTTRVIAPNGVWKFYTSAIGNITTSTLSATGGGLGTVVIAPTTLSASTSMLSSGESGFNFSY